MLYCIVTDEKTPRLIVRKNGKPVLFSGREHAQNYADRISGVSKQVTEQEAIDLQTLDFPRVETPTEIYLDEVTK